MAGYIDAILSLNRGSTSYGKAPYKPILLLAVIESFQFGEIQVNGMLLISDDYRILVKSDLKDLSARSGINEYEGKDLILPDDFRFLPSLDSLKSHRVKFGFQ